MLLIGGTLTGISKCGKQTVPGTEPSMNTVSEWDRTGGYPAGGHCGSTRFLVILCGGILLPHQHKPDVGSEQYCACIVGEAESFFFFSIYMLKSTAVADK